MYAKYIAAAALLAAPLVKATGSAIVDNQCTFPVYLWSVSNLSGPMVNVSSGSNYTEVYRANPNGGGISIKIAAESDQNAGITQFEYTLASTIWYDISNINGYPFEQWGVTLIPSDPTCTAKLCAAGISQCADAYNQPNDNLATADCSASADLVLVLCSGQTGNVPVSSISTVKASSTTSTSTKASSTSSAVAVSSTTTQQTSTTVKTSGTTFVTKTTSSSSSTSATSSVSPVVTAVAAVVSSTNSDDVEVIITEYVTSWVTVGGSDSTTTAAPTTSSDSPSTSTTSSSTKSFHQHGHHTFAARHEERRHVHRHARDVSA